MRITVEKFKDGTDVHAVISLTGRRAKRAKTRTVCVLRIEPMLRLAPHSNIAKEPPITCTVCRDGVTALNDLIHS